MYHKLTWLAFPKGVSYIYIYKYIYTIAIFKNEIYLNKLWDWYKYGLPFFSCVIFCFAFPSWMRNDPRITLWLDWVLEHLILWTSHCYFRQTVKKGQLAELKVFEYMLLQHDFYVITFQFWRSAYFTCFAAVTLRKEFLLKDRVTQVFLYISTGIYSSKPFIVSWAGFEKSPANALKQRWMYSA